MTGSKADKLATVNYIHLLLPDFALIIGGYLICRFTKLDRSVWGQVDALVYFFLFPVLLFHSITSHPLNIAATSHFMLAGVSLAVCGIGVAYSIPYWPIVGRYIDSRDHASSAQVGFRFNSYIALAVSETLLGDGGLLYIAILIGVCVPIFNIAAIWPMARHGQQGFLRELARNPLIWATTAGLSANLLGFMVPEWLDPSVTRVGQAGLVLGLMGAGAGMHLSALPRAKVMAVSVLSVKHIAMPLIAFAMARLWQLDTLQTSTLLIFSALPTASSCYVLAARMGYNGPYVSSLVTASTALAALSLPFALSVLSNTI